MPVDPREILMRHIADAAKAGDLQKVEDLILVVHALNGPRKVAIPDESAHSGRTYADVPSKEAHRPQSAPPQSTGPSGTFGKKEAREQGKLARHSFLSKVSAAGIGFTHSHHREYKTPKRRFVLLFANEDHRGDLWWFGTDQQYDGDIIIFLCRNYDGKLLDFVVPRPYLSSRWSNFSKSGGQVEFHVVRNSSGFAIRVPHGISLPISQFLSNLAPLKV